MFTHEVEYSTYFTGEGKNNKNVKDNLDTINYKNSALANRPLQPKKECKNCIKDACGCYKKKGPLTEAAKEDLFKPDIFKTDLNYNNTNVKTIPITITKDNDYEQYVVLEKERNKPDIITNLPVYDSNTMKRKELNTDKKTNYKINYVTQFYVGSLTVIGLFVFFRLIQKTK